MTQLLKGPGCRYTHMKMDLWPSTLLREPPYESHSIPQILDLNLLINSVNVCEVCGMLSPSLTLSAVASLRPVTSIFSTPLAFRWFFPSQLQFVCFQLFIYFFF